MQPTLEKASAVATQPELVSMFDTARAANPGAKAQLDALQARLTGNAVAAPVAAAAPRLPRPCPAAPVQQAAAPAPAPAPVVSGSLPLRGDPRLAEVRRLKEQEQYARCLAASTSPRSLEVLYERSWCAYSHQRPTEALVGFQEAARVGDALGPNVRRDAHFGMALSFLSMNMTEQGAQVASQVNLTDTQRREMETIVLDQRGVKAFGRKITVRQSAISTRWSRSTGPCVAIWRCCGPMPI
jgi:cellulose synthase operon protein C